MADKDITGWITVQGRRVPIRKGQSKAEAVKSNFRVRKGEGGEGNYKRKGQGEPYKKKPEQTMVGTFSRNGKRTVVKQSWDAVKKKSRISGRTQAGHDMNTVRSNVKSLTDAGLGDSPGVQKDKERVKELAGKNRQELRSRAKNRRSGGMNIKKR